MNASRWGWLARIAAVVILTWLLVAAIRRLDVARLVATLATVHLVWVVIACVTFASILPLWAFQWTLITPRTDKRTWRNMLGVVALTSTALNTTPLFVGEVAGATLLVTQIGISPAAALSVSVMDQLLVGIGKIAVITGAALTNPLPLWMSRGLLGLAAAVVLLAAFCLVLAHNIGDHRWSALSTFAKSLEPLRTPRLAIGAVVIALVKRSVELLAILCVQHAFGVQLPAASALLILAALNLATLVPLVPGNFGVYEGVVTVTYSALGVAPETAAAMGIVQHACFVAALALPGYLFLAVSGTSRNVAAAR